MSATGGTFTNPVLPGFHPDPSICRAGDRYYLVVSSFEYFPGIPIFESDDLVEWRQIGHVLDRPSQLDLDSSPDSGGIYAPTIRHHDGTFFVTSTNVSAGGHFIVHASDPAGDWSDPVFIAQDGIDPSLFFEDDEVYFTSNVEPDPSGTHELVPSFQRGIQQSLLDPYTGLITRGPKFIWEGTGARYPEGPHLFKRGGWYYMLIAEGGTEYGHFGSIGRSPSPWGPFEPSPRGPLIDHRSIASPFYAVGHADFVETQEGTWWAVCHGIRPASSWGVHILGRETLLAPVTWHADDWPTVGTSGVVPTSAIRPLAVQAAPDEARSHSDRENFDQSSLSFEWSSVRRPPTIPPSTGFLELQANGATLDSAEPCFVGRRQQHHAFHAATRLAKLPEGDEEEAGLIIRMNRNHYFAIGVRRRNGIPELIVRQRALHLDLETVLRTVDDAAIELSAEGQRGYYELRAQQGSGSWQMGPLASGLLSTELAGGYTGVFLGLYAASDAPSSAPVRFDWFDYASEERPTDPSLAPTTYAFHQGENTDAFIR